MKNFTQIERFLLVKVFSPFSSSDYSSLFSFPQQLQPFARAVIHSPLNREGIESKTEKNEAKILKTISHHAPVMLLSAEGNSLLLRR